MVYKQNTFNRVCVLGHIQIAEWYIKHSPNLQLSENTMGYVLEKGNLAIIKLLAKYNIINKLSDEEMTTMIANGHVHILDWFADSIIAEPYDIVSYANFAMEQGYLGIVEWFQRKYALYGIGCAFAKIDATHIIINGYTHVLEWLVQHQVQITYKRSAITKVTYHQHYAVLEWFKRTGLKLQFAAEIIRVAVRIKDVKLMEWLQQTDWEFDWLDAILKIRMTGNRVGESDLQWLMSTLVQRTNTDIKRKNHVDARTNRSEKREKMYVHCCQDQESRLGYRRIRY